ncbi:MAG TPA: carboxypeptidase regulatory-like domain-containing protein [Terracidiphilus sp.]|nr:carboxypeptidase regulatory-like domain-containing protein [Terracidiphilus sp.]
MQRDEGDFLAMELVPADIAHFFHKGLMLLKDCLGSGPPGLNAGCAGKAFFAAGLVILLVFAPMARTQQPAQSAWQGMVRNAGGAPIAGAKVRLAGKGAEAEAVTGTDGGFRLSPLANGQYLLTVQARGRRVNYTQPIDLEPAGRAVVLTLSDRGELAVAVLQSQGATGGEELSSQAVSELPLNKRDFGTLLLLAAGTMTDANGATNFTAQFAVNGQRGVEAVFAMDGADISDPEMGGATFSNFNVDAVEQIQSNSGWMPAEIGRGAAGFTNIVTRSGASGFHGSFFEFVRNSAFDARNYFDHATLAYPGRIPPFRRNEFGFTNGGPIYVPKLYDGRSRTFYFTEYQGFRQVLGTTQVMPVPTATERTGQDTVTYPDGSVDTLMVPVDPGIAAVLKRYPLPNYPSGSFQQHTYATASKVATNADQFSLRIDHRMSEKDQFFARFTLDNLSGPTTNPDQTAIDPTFGVEYIDRERNVVGTWTRTISPRLILETSLSIQRSTPGFPTVNRTDPAVKFNDGLFEAFDSAAGTVMQAYGNLFHLRGNVAYTTAHHALKFGAEGRVNRDTTYFGISPDGEYGFGGGVAYSEEHIPSKSGKHDVNPGSPLPDTLSSFLSGSPFAYSISIAPPYFSNSDHIGPAAINRNNVNAYIQDTWKVNSRLTLNFGVRWELYTPITERARRTGGFLYANGKQEYVVNPQPGYRTEWKGWGPRIQASWEVNDKLQAHAGGGITVIPPNIWQDNFLTGSAPFAVMPRLLSAANAPIHYGFKITPSQLPRTYMPGGADIFPTGRPETVAPNTVMDVNRYEQDVAALTPGRVVSDLVLSGVDRNFGNGTLYTWTAGFERKFGNLTAEASYVGTASEKLPRSSFPNAYPGADPAFAPWTTFDNSGNVIGGNGFENLVTATAHSTYHALQTSLSGTVGHGGPGIQASYTWSKSIDDTSQVIGGTGSTGAVAQGFPQNPYDTHPERGPSSFDVTHGFGLSLAQDLHLESVNFLHPLSRKVTDGWELLSISGISSGSPFTIFSGIQQTGAGSNGVDRPDQVAKPHLSTARKVREDYFGEGSNNATAFFNIPLHVVGGTGPNQGRFGTLGRNTFRGPAYYNFDFALIKDTPFGRRKSGAERIDMQFRGEFFNLFNIVNMGLPANILNGSGFGEISKTAGTSRQIQLSLKLIY